MMTDKTDFQERIMTREQLVTALGPHLQTGLLPDRLTSEHVALIQVSPLVVLSTCGPNGVDCSPRGDLPGFVRIQNDRTLMIPDRGRSPRFDALLNILADDRIGLLFVIPGSGLTLRVSGRASITMDPVLLGSFEVDGELPRAIIVVAVGAIYYWASLAMDRAALWNTETYVNPSTLPKPSELEAARSRSSGPRE